MSEEQRITEGGGGGVERGVEVEGELVQSATELTDRDRWGEGSKLLFQPGYLKVLKTMALSGQLQRYNLRSVVWRLFLNVLPEDQSQWETSTIAARQKFEEIKKKYMMDPHQATASLDITLNNPLSQSEESPWNKFFQDNELRQLVNQDVIRTFPDVQFFRDDDIQQTMEDILFCYVREHPKLGYRQGMHELLAPILFVMHAEKREVEEDMTLAPVLKVVMDPAYIEHDTFAIFSELMEMVEPWYSSTCLEADQVKAEKQAKSLRRNNMNHDPRTSRPFQDDISGPSSAISRKLDVVHNVLLKNADETLYLHLKQLAIPPQTYGIRWIRLLFGREFPFISVLEVWDALFADGPSLVDYMCVSMLIHIRDVLIEGDYAVCMHHLMHFPTLYEVNYLIQRSLHLRMPSQYPSPRVWTHHNQTHPLSPVSPSPQPSPPLHHHNPQPSLSKPKATVISALSTAGKQLKIKRKDGGIGTGGGVGGIERSVSPQEPTPPLVGPNPTIGKTMASLPDYKEPKKGRGRIIGELHSSGDKEMKNNPKIQQLQGSMNQVEWLTSRVDDLEAKLAYCGSKMDSLLLSMEGEVSELSDAQQLSPDTENTLLISLAGLKHVRDILLNKISFSGSILKDDEHSIIAPKPKSDPINAHPLEMSVQAHPVLSQDQPLVAHSNGGEDDAVSPREQAPPIPPAQVNHPLMSSGEQENTPHEDWVSVSPNNNHPLVT